MRGSCEALQGWFKLTVMIGYEKNSRIRWGTPLCSTRRDDRELELHVLVGLASRNTCIEIIQHCHFHLEIILHCHFHLEATHRVVLRLNTCVVRLLASCVCGSNARVAPIGLNWFVHCAPNMTTSLRQNRPGTAKKDLYAWSPQDMDDMNTTLVCHQYIQQLIRYVAFVCGLDAFAVNASVILWIIWFHHRNWVLCSHRSNCSDVEKIVTCPDDQDPDVWQYRAIPTCVVFTNFLRCILLCRCVGFWQNESLGTNIFDRPVWS